MLSVVRTHLFLSRDRAIILASLIGISLLAWSYLATMTLGMADMPGMPMPSVAQQYTLAALMWAVMMVGMMLPSAAPMILLYTMVQRKQGRRPVLMSGVFGAGYLLVWGGFAIVAAGLQLALARAALLSPSLMLVSARVAGVVFLLAAAYEFSPLKNRCLTRCQSPFGFITRYWQAGLGGALRMGVLHGAFCVGCCWVLMMLLFAAGVMNLVWVAALSVLILLQKVLPGGRLVPRVTGAVMAVVGLTCLVFPL